LCPELDLLCRPTAAAAAAAAAEADAVLQVEKQRVELQRELELLAERLQEAGGVSQAQVHARCHADVHHFLARRAFSLRAHGCLCAD